MCRSNNPQFESVPPVRPKVLFEEIVREKQTVVDSLRASNQSKAMTSFHSVELLEGQAKLVPPDKIDVHAGFDRGVPNHPSHRLPTQGCAIKGVERAIDSEKALELNVLLDSLAVIG